MEAPGPIPRLRCLARLSSRDADVVLRLIEHRMRLIPPSRARQHGLRRLQIYRRALRLPQSLLWDDEPELVVKQTVAQSHARSAC